MSEILAANTTHQGSTFKILKVDDLMYLFVFIISITRMFAFIVRMMTFNTMDSFWHYWVP